MNEEKLVAAANELISIRERRGYSYPDGAADKIARAGIATFKAGGDAHEVMDAMEQCAASLEVRAAA